MFISSMYRLRFVVVAILTYTCGIMDLGSGHGGGGSLSFFVNAEFGDYADLSYDCPYITTCRTICVTNITECPAELQCADGEEVCADGRCSDDCETTGREIWGDYYDSIGDRCLLELYPVPCASTTGTLEECNSLYQDYYDTEDTFFYDPEYYWSYYNYFYFIYYNPIEYVSWTEGLFIVAYAWMGGLTFLIFLWNMSNYNSVSAETKKALQLKISTQSSTKVQQQEQPESEILTLESTLDDSSANRTDRDDPIDNVKIDEGIQMGYDGNWITNFAGRILYILSLVTMIGFFAVLVWLIIEYYQNLYSQTFVKHFNPEKRVFSDNMQVLKAFVVTYVTGFVWTLAFKWPYSIEYIFFRRTVLGSATHVAVYYNKNPSNKGYGWFTKDSRENIIDEDSGAKNVYSSGYMSSLRIFFQSFFNFIDGIMGYFWCDYDQYHRRGGTFEVCQVKTDVDGSRYFVFKFRRYNYSSDSGCFTPASYTVGTTIGELLEAGNKKGGLAHEEVVARRSVVGSNSIEMEKPNILYVFFTEANNGWYLYQLYLIFSWLPNYYFYMALFYTLVVLVALLIETWFSYQYRRSIYKLAAIAGSTKVVREGMVVEVHPKELVPGDLVQVKPGLSHADMVVVSDGICLVDESALTGEANPKAKIALDVSASMEQYDPNIHKRRTISAGTNILEAQNDTMALVVKTGSNTSRGQLLQEIFSYERHRFKFDAESLPVITILVFYAAVAFTIVFLLVDAEPVQKFFFGMYVIAGAIPVLTPAVYTFSVGVSDNRLSKKNIACVKPESILVAGKVRRAFFDKTGTLTSEGLSFVSARSASEWKIGAFNLYEQDIVPEDMEIMMATCHSLTRSRITGDLVGNPVDINMFKATGAFLLDREYGNFVTIADKTGNQVVVVKRFDFDHQRMTQSCIVQTHNSLVVYVKGSGESIRELCRQTSLPDDFDLALQQSARSGMYQISMAMKVLPHGTDFRKLTRDEVEKDLSFVGVINFKNTMRGETPDVIRELREGDIQSTMVTGDNIMTGIRIAKESGIIGAGQIIFVAGVDDNGKVVWRTESNACVPQPTMSLLSNGGIDLAVSGAAWRKLLNDDPSHAAEIGEYIQVYGRCTPQDKVSVVATFSKLGYVTCMCGDGANDSGALKTAHVGIALSDAEASIVAPFASLDKSIESVLEVLKEGRCGLASSLASYKYIIMYGQIITINQVVNSYYNVTFGEWNWIAVDFLWPVTLALALVMAKQAKALAKTRPTASLLGFQTVGGVAGQVFINLCCTIVSLRLLNAQDWYQCRKWVGEEISDDWATLTDNYEAQVIFFVTGYQMVAAAMSFNFGYEFRRGWYRNYMFMILAFFYSFIHFYALFVPSRLSCMFRANCVNENIEWRDVWVPYAIGNDWNHTMMPVEFRWVLFFVILFNTAAILAWEYLFINGIRRRSASGKQQQEEWL